jgi:hypothetical protein
VSTRLERLHRAIVAFAVAAGASCVLLALPEGASATCANEAVREQQGAQYLPECRGYELVSPAEKNGEEVGFLDPGVSNEVAFQAAASVPAAFFILDGAPPHSLTAALWTPNISRLTNPGEPWQSVPEAPANEFQGYPPSDGRKNNWAYLSPDLDCGVEITDLPQAEHPGTGEQKPELPEGETLGEPEPIYNIYARNFETNTNELVTQQSPRAPQRVTEASGSMHIDGVSSDCKHVLFESQVSGYELHVTPEGNSFAPSSSLYEWTEGGRGPRVASILPGGEPASEVQSASGKGIYGSPLLNDFVVDGGSTFVFFGARSPTTKAESGIQAGTEQIYMRIDGSRTRAISTSDTVKPDEGAVLEAASDDGSRILFLANYGLTATSSEGSHAASNCDLPVGEENSRFYGEGCDLYEYHVTNAETGEGELKDISADIEANTGDTQGANVRGVVGISDDGSSVYFSASGRLAPNAASEAENELISGEKSSPQVNVYLYRGGSLTFLTKISQLEGGSGPGIAYEKMYDALVPASGKNRDYYAARVSPNGDYALLASVERLTAYDNEDRKTFVLEAAQKSNAPVARIGEPAPAVTFVAEQKLEGSYTLAEVGGKVGDVVDYKLTLANNGTEPLIVERVADPGCTNITVGASEVKAGESASWTCEHELVSNREPTFTNAAEVTVNKSFLKSNDVTAKVVNGLIVTKEQKLPHDASYTTGELSNVSETLEYKITFRNTSAHVLRLQGFADDKCTNLTKGATELKPGESTSWTCEHPLAENEKGSYGDAAAVTSMRPARDVEQYEFDGTGVASCVSCAPDGERPAEPEGEHPINNKGLSAFIEQKVMAIQHNLMDDGRVFFDSFTPLVESADAAGDEADSAYEWIPEGLSGCESVKGCVGILDVPAGNVGTYFMDASENGENVYIDTPLPLAREDPDDLRDIYDVRTNGGKLYVSPPLGCEANGTSCQPETSNGVLGFGHQSETGIGGGQFAGPLVEILGSTVRKSPAPIKVGSHRTKGAAVVLQLFVPSAGRLTVSGPGLKTVERSVTKAQAYTLKIGLGQKASTAVRRHRRVKIKVHVSFKSASGTSSAASFTASFV